MCHFRSNSNKPPLCPCLTRPRRKPSQDAYRERGCNEHVLEVGFSFSLGDDLTRPLSPQTPAFLRGSLQTPSTSQMGLTLARLHPAQPPASAGRARSCHQDVLLNKPPGLVRRRGWLLGGVMTEMWRARVPEGPAPSLQPEHSLPGMTHDPRE